MAEVSIIEFLVYGLVGYTGIIMLIATAFREAPAMRSQSIVRSIWILAPIFCMYMLASAGATIVLHDDITTTSTLINANTTETWTETVTTEQQEITLLQPVWVTLHFLFFIMLIIYFIWNMLNLLVKRE